LSSPIPIYGDFNFSHGIFLNAIFHNFYFSQKYRVIF
jgi:hypothetical protein